MYIRNIEKVCRNKDSVNVLTVNDIQPRGVREELFLFLFPPIPIKPFPFPFPPIPMIKTYSHFPDTTIPDSHSHYRREIFRNIESQEMYNKTYSKHQNIH